MGKKRSNQVRRRDIDGIGRQTFNTVQFPGYTSDSEQGKNYLIPVIKRDFQMANGEHSNLTGRDILYSLYNLYDEMNKPGCPFLDSDMVQDWCVQNIHPYHLQELYTELKDPQNTSRQVVEYYGAVNIEQFTEELGKLYQHFRFYLALEDLKHGHEELAFNLAVPGRLSSGYTYFESYKFSSTPITPWTSGSGFDKELLLAEMKKTSAQLVISEEDISKRYRLFQRSPMADITELEDILIEQFPDFTMNVCRMPGMGKIGFTAGLNSVFDIAWYTLARLVVMDDEDVDPNSLSRPRVCKACGRIFTPESPRQLYCLYDECQRARKRKNRRDCDARKRQKAQSAISDK